MSLTCLRRRHVIVIAAVLVIGNEDDRILPQGPVAHGVHDLRNERLPSLYVRWRMLIVFELPSGQTEIGIDERHLRQRTYAGCSCSLRQEHLKRQEVWIHACRAEQPEAASLRRILEVVGPGYFTLIEQVEDGSGDRLVASRRRKRIVGGQMSKRRHRHKIRAV